MEKSSYSSPEIDTILIATEGIIASSVEATQEKTFSTHPETRTSWDRSFGQSEE